MKADFSTTNVYFVAFPRIMHIRKEISSNELNPKKFTFKRLILWYIGRNLSVPEYNIQTRNLLAYLERYDTDLTEKICTFRYRWKQLDK
jgi:hypothetical protein